MASLSSMHRYEEIMLTLLVMAGPELGLRRNVKEVKHALDI